LYHKQKNYSWFKNYTGCFLKYSALLILLLNTNSIQAQYFPQGNPNARPSKSKQPKVVPRFPPQVYRTDTTYAKKMKEDSLRKAGLLKPSTTNTAVVNAAKPVNKYESDTLITLVSSKQDVNGNTIKVFEYAAGRKKFRRTIIVGAVNQLNRPFNIDTIDKDSITVQVVKKNHRLYVYHKHKFLTSYQCVFGPPHLEQKQKEGDRKTPEGWFKILEIRGHGEWVNFMLLDYPNQESYKIWEENKRSGVVKSSDRIGSAIGIHGVWDGGDMAIDARKNWTDGCVALKRADVTELVKLVKIGTSVNIRKNP
jgi:L,D-peptidoglycan transpeptidase YkuD (ErfK/YbiS/YcfS/YnhG family)